MVEAKDGIASAQNVKIAIVGGGLSGMSAAYTLKKAGVWADVYEASGSTGGRCRNDYTDGYEFFMGAGSTEPQWETTFSYLNELGIDHLVNREAGEAGIGFVTKGQPHILHLGGSPKDILKSFVEFLPTFPAPVYAQGIKFLGLIGKYQKALDFKGGDFSALDELSDISIYDWCHANGYADLCTYVLDPLVSNMVCANSHLVSMGHVIMLFSLMTGMCTIKGGMGVISETLYEQVKDRIQLRTKVEEVVVEDGKVRGVKIDGQLVEADHVIVGLDAIRTLKLVPGLSQVQKDALATCNYSKVFYYQFGLEKPVQSLTHSAAFFAANEDNWLAGVSQAHEEDGHPIILSQTRIERYDELAAMTEEERTAKIIAETRRVLPDFPANPKIVKNYRWDIAVNLEGPGQFKAINDLKANHMHDVEGLHLAGDYQFLIASTEGSMDAGRRRAEEILQAIGVPVPKLRRPAPESGSEAKKPATFPLAVAVGSAAAAAIVAFSLSRRKK